MSLCWCLIIKIKNVHLPKEAEDGFRVLVDRLWPRGITKQKASIDLWLKDLAPSDELRKWYSHDESKWNEFKIRYYKELQTKQSIVDTVIAEEKKNKTVRLVFSSKSPLNNAQALLEYIKKGGQT